MRLLVRVVMGVVCLSLVSPLLASAQEAEAEPVVHVIAITTFHVPLGPARRNFLDYIDKYVVPPTQEDPNIVSARFGIHEWGGSEPNIWMISEYESMAAVEESTAWQEAWYDEHFPEGTPERETADKAFDESYAPYFSNHTDNLLESSMNRAK